MPDASSLMNGRAIFSTVLIVLARVVGKREVVLVTCGNPATEANIPSRQAKHVRGRCFPVPAELRGLVCAAFSVFHVMSHVYGGFREIRRDETGLQYAQAFLLQLRRTAVPPSWQPGEPVPLPSREWQEGARQCLRSGVMAALPQVRVCSHVCLATSATAEWCAVLDERASYPEVCFCTDQQLHLPVPKKSWRSWLCQLSSRYSLGAAAQLILRPWCASAMLTLWSCCRWLRATASRQRGSSQLAGKALGCPWRTRRACSVPSRMTTTRVPALQWRSAPVFQASCLAASGAVSDSPLPFVCQATSAWPPGLLTSKPSRTRLHACQACSGGQHLSCKLVNLQQVVLVLSASLCSPALSVSASMHAVRSCLHTVSHSFPEPVLCSRCPAASTSPIACSQRATQVRRTRPPKCVRLTRATAASTSWTQRTLFTAQCCAAHRQQPAESAHAACKSVGRILPCPQPQAEVCAGLLS